MSKDKEKSGDEEYQEYKMKFNKFMWNLFIFQRIPIILMWIAFLLGLILGILSK